MLLLISQHSFSERSNEKKCKDFAYLVHLRGEGIKNIINIDNYKNIYKKKLFSKNTERNIYLDKVIKAIFDSGFNLKEPGEERTKLEVQMDSIKELHQAKNYDLCAFIGEEFFSNLDKINLAGEFKGPFLKIRDPVTLDTEYNTYRFGRKIQGR